MIGNTRIAAMVVLATASLLAAGLLIRGHGDAAAETDPAPAAPTNRVPASVHNATELQALREMAHGDPVQLAALEDGYITLDENEAALSAYAACLESAGVTAVIDPGKGLRPGSIEMMIFPPTGDDSPRANHELAGRCRGAHFDAVNSAWAGQVPLITPAESAAQVARLEACVAAGGVAGAEQHDNATSDASRGFPLQYGQLTAYIQCARLEQEQTGFLSPMPGPATTP